MEFKVGASVWTNSQESQMQAAPRSGLTDFREKLDLSGEERFRRDAPGRDCERNPSKFSNERAPHEMPAKCAELYSWGLEAGPHLSFSFVAEAQFVSGMYERNTPIAASVRPLPHPDAAVRPMVVIDAETVSDRPGNGFMSSEVRSSIALGESGEVAIASERLQTFLAQRWPHSRFSILPGRNGLDVIVRDFYLSEVELQSLAKNLKEKMESSSTMVGTIWINGRPIWQRGHYV